LSKAAAAAAAAGEAPGTLRSSQGCEFTKEYTEKPIWKKRKHKEDQEKRTLGGRWKKQPKGKHIKISSARLLTFLDTFLYKMKRDQCMMWVPLTSLQNTLEKPPPGHQLKNPPSPNIKAKAIVLLMG
jgi:hypothetical protein